MPAPAKPLWNRVAVVGVGMIGGSIGVALLRRGLAREVVGIGRNAGSLAAAADAGVISRGTTDFEAGIDGAGLVVVCTPVGQIADFALRACKQLGDSALVTDAGSTKREIVTAVERKLPKGALFVGSHPLAGSEKSGHHAAMSDLLVGRTVIITPTRKTPLEATAEVETFWRRLGGATITMTPQAHDRAVAAISHLPHLAAAALAASTPKQYLPLAARGWLDTTRVASGDVAMWRQIFESNRAEALTALARYEKVLAACRQALKRGDFRRLEQLLLKAKQTRDALGS
ncbi:MAG: prephenate dehydrogenase [Planctomycetes bacterium]|nr:prephenate dehydrogenase [Planctomycetota bacterium]